MLFWPVPSCWVALGLPGCSLSPIGSGLPFWVSWKVVGAFLCLQALNSHTEALEHEEPLKSPRIPAVGGQDSPGISQVCLRLQPDVQHPT